MNNKIKVILWDLDGTILDFLAAEKVAIRTCFNKFGLGECTDEMIAEYSKINVKYWKMLERGEMSKPAILEGRFREFFEKKGIDTSIAKAFNDEYQIRLGDTISYHEGAREMLEKYQGVILQCAVTNGTKTAQERKLRASGLDKIFDHIFISEDIGAEKPDVRFFDKVFEMIGDYKKNEVMIIGDSLTSDMKGGYNAGIVKCWYNPFGVENADKDLVDYEIKNLMEVTKLII